MITDEITQKVNNRRAGLFVFSSELNVQAVPRSGRRLDHVQHRKWFNVIKTTAVAHLQRTNNLPAL